MSETRQREVLQVAVANLLKPSVVDALDYAETLRRILQRQHGKSNKSLLHGAGGAFCSIPSKKLHMS